MQLKTNNLKFINMKIKINFLLLIGMLAGSFSFAQQYEVIEEVKAEVKSNQADQGRIKIDGVAAVVGSFVILESDIDKTLIDLKNQGIVASEISRCQLLGKLLEDKLYAHQAIQDSIVVKDEDINAMVDQQLGNIIEQLGSEKKAIEFYQKTTIEELRQELFEIDRGQKLSQEMQNKIIDPLEVTPDEVRQFFNKIPENERPVFGAEVEISQIVVKPLIDAKQTQAVVDRLNTIRRDVLENGSSFASKAILYSQDPGSRSKGGLYVISKKTGFAKEFKDVAFSLQEGEISEPFETEFGWHIIQLDRIRGQDRELRHILLIPEVTKKDEEEAKVRIDSIRSKIVNNELSFADAARLYSDEKETKANGGKLFNPQTMETRLEITRLDPTVYERVVNLKNNEISLPFIEEELRTERKSYKIIMVTNRYDEHVADFVKDYSRIKELALREKQINAIGKWTEEKIKDNYISIGADYKDCEFAANWLKK